MEKLKIALCDDDKSALDIIASAVQSALTQQGAAAEITTCVSISELQRWMEFIPFDLLLLDIDMPLKNGISFGQDLRSRDSRVDIIYISGREDMVFESLKVHPLSFVRKSHFLEDLPTAIQTFLRSRSEHAVPERLVLEQRDKLLVLDLKDICYFEGARNNQLAYVQGQATPVPLRRPMQELEEELSPKGFVRIHKGYLVNCAHIRLIQENRVILTDGSVLPLSRRKIQETKQRFLNYMKHQGAVTM